jgi:hypothetical protein
MPPMTLTSLPPAADLASAIGRGDPVRTEPWKEGRIDADINMGIVGHERRKPYRAHFAAPAGIC